MRRGTMAALAAAVMALPAAASERVAYTYAALGRLERATTSGTVNHGLEVWTGYDPAGNRASYGVSGAGPAAGMSGGEAATSAFGEGALEAETAGNRPPVALDDEGLIGRCGPGAFTVLGNDFDPDGDIPLRLVGVSVNAAAGTASASGDRIIFTPGGAGTAAISYQVAEALGATASATLLVTVTDEPCAR